MVLDIDAYLERIRWRDDRRPTLFAAVLEALGFQPVRHTARVVLYLPRTASPRTHMLLTVAVEGGRFVVDPGFGGFAPRRPSLTGSCCERRRRTAPFR